MLTQAQAAALDLDQQALPSGIVVRVGEHASEGFILTAHAMLEQQARLNLERIGWCGLPSWLGVPGRLLWPAVDNFNERAAREALAIYGNVLVRNP